MAKRSHDQAASCDGCLGKIRSIPTRNKKLYANVNSYVMTVEDGFSRYVCCYPLQNKEALTIALKLAYEHFPRYSLNKYIQIKD